MTSVSQLHTDRFVATVQNVEALNPDTVCVRLTCPEEMRYKPGQYIRVFVNEQTARYYSLASVPGIDHELHLHIRRGAAGSASRWFHEEIEPGDPIHIGGPRGYCCYQQENPDQSLLMIGTGTGLAPLYAMARAALTQGHVGKIHLYHGVRKQTELYLVDRLQALSRLHPNFHYVPCLSGGEDAPGCRSGRALDIALADIALSSDWRVLSEWSSRYGEQRLEGGVCDGRAT